MSKEKIICWRGTDGDLQPIKCVCDDKFGYPNWCKDENGNHEQMYQNTHFKTKEEAWKSIISSVKAGVSLSGSFVKRCTDELTKAEKEAAKSVMEFHQVKSNPENPFVHEM